jgi:type I restriction enzyme S subunit
MSGQFIEFALRTEFVRQQYLPLILGTTSPHLNVRDVKPLRLPLAPFGEQKRIVARIEEVFSDLDAGLASLERVRANLKRYRAAVLKAAVEGRLTAEWREKHRRVEPASELLGRILAERRRRWEAEQEAKFAASGKAPPKSWREKYAEPTPPDTSNLRELPDGWCWASVEQVSLFARYGSSAKTSKGIEGIPVLRMGNIEDGSLQLKDLKYLPSTHSEFPDLLLQPGDLLFNRTNSAELVGKSAVYEGNPTPCSYASYLIAVRCVPGLEPKYLCFFLNSSHGRRWIAAVVSQQVGQANVNGTKLLSLVFPLPPPHEQGQIITEVEQRLSNLAAAELQIGRDLLRSARLRQSILKRAFEGKLVPQDPYDEPASALLEQIKAEHQAVTGNGEASTTARRGRKGAR